MNSLPAPPKVAILSDVSVGYGSPQVLRMAESFAQVFGAEVFIFEPDESERNPVEITRHVNSSQVCLERVYTSAHPYWMQGRIEYCRKVANRLRTVNPDILLFSTMFGIPTMEFLDLSKKLKIFYCLEDIDFHYRYLFPLVRQCDIYLFPEENRRRIYSNRLNISGSEKPSFIIYNTNRTKKWCEPELRRARLFYGGSFDKIKNYGDYFLESEIARVPIDIYGVVRGFDDNEATISTLHSTADNSETIGVRYRGYQQSDDRFFEMLSSYLYSIVIWNPEREDHFYACPNKFFDAISCGVPPICAPHPQCVELVSKWKCGFLMDDWSFDSFKNSIYMALKYAGTDYHREMAFNCRQAIEEELSWERQFEKLIPSVSKYLHENSISA